MTAPKRLRVLIVEDSPDDAWLLVRQIEDGGYEVEHERVETADQMVEALEDGGWDVILADWSIPGFGGDEALDLVQDHGVDVPFILATGTIGEERAVEALRAGAHDFVLKDNLGRLVPAIEREMREARNRIRLREAHEALERSEARFRHIARVSGDALWEYDARTDTTTWRSEAYRTFFDDGSEGPNSGRDWIERLHPDDRERVETSFVEAIGARSDAWLDEFRLLGAAGAVTWVYVRTLLSYDEQGRWIGLVGATMDVTEPNETREALRERTFELGERVKEMECLLDVSRILQEWRDRPESETMARLVGRLPGGWQHPERARARIEVEDRVYESPGFERTSWLLRAEIPGNGGPVGSIEVAYPEEPPGGGAIFLDEERRLLEAIAERTSEAIRRRAAESDLRRSEAYYRALIENASDIVTIMEPDGTIRYESSAVERVLGYDPDERIGASAFDYVHPDDVDRLRGAILEGLRSGALFHQASFRLRHRNGDWHHVESTGTNLVGTPDIEGIVVTTRDVTERKALEEQLRQAQKMEAIGRLAGGVAHDFNNALTVIKGYSEMLVGLCGSCDEGVEGASEIHEAADRAATLTRRLLAFSRRDVTQPIVIDVGEITRGMERMLRRMIGEDVALRLSLDDTPMRVWMDPGNLEQVLMNLAVNAREAMPGGGELAVSAGVAASEGLGAGPGRVVLEVRDTGPGMSGEVMEHLFEPFYTTKEEGTGLGLSIVYGIVDGAGGRISVESVPGEGSTFTIHLPVTSRAVSSGNGHGEAPRPEAPARILLLEDETMVRNLAKRILEKAGHTVHEADDPGAALEMLEDPDLEIDLFVTDVVMPGRSGFEVAQAVRERFPEAKVLFMSGYPEDERVRETVRDVGSSFLQKPFTAPDLLESVQALQVSG